MYLSTYLKEEIYSTRAQRTIAILASKRHLLFEFGSKTYKILKLRLFFINKQHKTQNLSCVHPQTADCVFLLKTIERVTYSQITMEACFRH